MTKPMANQQKRDAIARSVPLGTDDLGVVFASFEIASDGRFCVCLSLTGNEPGHQIFAAEPIELVADIPKAIEYCLIALRNTTRAEGKADDEDTDKNREGTGGNPGNGPGGKS